MFDVMFPGMSTIRKLILIRLLLDQKKAQEEKEKQDGTGNA